MLLEIFSLYLLGLLCSMLTVLLICGFWLLSRMRRQLDKSAKERQAFLYDMIMIALITIPVLAFAYMAIFLMIKA